MLTHTPNVSTSMVCECGVILELETLALSSPIRLNDIPCHLGTVASVLAALTLLWMTFPVNITESKPSFALSSHTLLAARRGVLDVIRLNANAPHDDDDCFDVVSMYCTCSSRLWCLSLHEFLVFPFFTAVYLVFCLSE